MSTVTGEQRKIFIESFYESNWDTPFVNGPSNIVQIVRETNNSIKFKLFEIDWPQHVPEIVKAMFANKKFLNWHEFADAMLAAFIEIGKVCKHTQMFQFGYLSNEYAAIRMPEIGSDYINADDNDFVEKLSSRQFFRLITTHCDSENPIFFLPENDSTTKFLLTLFC